MLIYVNVAIQSGLKSVIEDKLKKSFCLKMELHLIKQWSYPVLNHCAQGNIYLYRLRFPQHCRYHPIVLLHGISCQSGSFGDGRELRGLRVEAHIVPQLALLFCQLFRRGDARKLLNILDIMAGATSGDIEITDESVTACLQQNIALYDKNGEQHYDVISAFIKSVRGSDPNAAIYYLARMLAGGEEPRFIARRLVILASEDIGLANPNALLLANACFDTVHKIGMPEARITLAETTIYLATSPKSNSAYMAINEALSFVSHDTTNRPVPLHLRNAPTKLMSEAGYGKGYKYAHDFAGGVVEQEFLPESISGKRFYTPNTQNPSEAKIAERIRTLWGNKYSK